MFEIIRDFQQPSGDDATDQARRIDARAASLVIAEMVIAGRHRLGFKNG